MEQILLSSRTWIITSSKRRLPELSGRRLMPQRSLVFGILFDSVAPFVQFLFENSVDTRKLFQTSSISSYILPETHFIRRRLPKLNCVIPLCRSKNFFFHFYGRIILVLFLLHFLLSWITMVAILSCPSEMCIASQLLTMVWTDPCSAHSLHHAQVRPYREISRSHLLSEFRASRL